MISAPTEVTEVSSRALRRCRWAIGLFIAGVILSGVTAFPLAWELDLLASWISPGGALHTVAPAGLQHWILHVRDGLAHTYSRYPWVAYGTDWLAFGHIAIALFFIPAWRDPVRHVTILRVGLWVCALVIPFAFIAGPLRGIPFHWSLIDCSFGVFGAIPLWYALRTVAHCR
jgi:hypothetical protein